MEKQRTRNEIEEKYKWDLTTIFKTDEEFIKELEETNKFVEEITKFEGKIMENSNSLYECLMLDDQIERKIYRLYYYAHLNYDADTTNTKYQGYVGKVENLFVKYSELTSFIVPEMYETKYEKVKEFIKENPLLQEYSFVLEDFYRYENHKLTKEQEDTISKLSKAFSNSSDIYESLRDSDMKFGTIVNEEGKEVELTESNYTIFRESTDRRVRKEAFEGILNTYGNFKNTIANLFKTNVESLTTNAKFKKYNSSLEASLFNDNVTPEIYNKLIDTIHENLDILYKYYDVKKDILGFDELHLYDTYVSLINECNKKYSFDEAKEIVINALSVLGEDYINNLNKAFDERWIDIYNNKGKRGGAYSSGFYDTNPFVLLNYEGRLDDVSTLAHELGHSMHTYYSCKNNPYQTSNYQIFVAEVASTVNEMLLNKYLLKNSKDNKEKLYILNNMIDMFKATVYRQVMFAEFERDMHALAEQGEILTNDVLCDKYYELNKKYFGENVVVDEEIKYEWERIPHFYYNFYVYKYAIGLTSACHIVENILSGKEGAVESYLKFLKSGGSNYPVEELKIANVDITTGEVVKSSIKMFDEMIDEFKELYKEEYK